MKSVTILLSIALLVLLESIAYGQEPVEPIDLTADSLIVSFPCPDSIRINAYFSSHTTNQTIGSYSFNVLMTLGGQTIYDEAVTVTIPTSNDCGEYPNCSSDVCEVVVTGAKVEKHYCGPFRFWAGSGCDPSFPEGTCIPIDICVCNPVFMVTTTLDYSGDDELVLYVDSYNAVSECDETNNVYILSSVGAEKTSWSEIKARYTK